jgi:hypothetical protein
VASHLGVVKLIPFIALTNLTQTPTIKLTGQSLVTFNEEQFALGRTRTEIVIDAGYVRDNGSAEYTEYYTELLRAKQELDPGYLDTKDVEDAEYDALSGTEQELYDAVHEKFGEKWDHEEIIGFLGELEDIGIETPEALGEAFEYQTDSYKAEEEFAEQLVTEVISLGIPSILEGHIDWQSVWDCELRYDYNSFEFDGETFFFRNN